MQGRLAPRLLLLAASLVAWGLRAAPVTIDLATSHQRIRGFGGSTVFQPTTPLSAANLDTLFGNGSGQIGFTLLRIRVSTTASWRELELANALGARARGAEVIATPWSPPAELKTNQSLIGGALRSDAYAAYATYLNDFATTMADRGAPLYAISVQNEPDYQVTYESCDWTPAEMLEFCRHHAGAITATRVIAPESFQFRRALSDPLLNDDLATACVDLIGGHIYGGGLTDYPLARARGKEVWMTEHLDLSTDWAGALATGKEMHDCLAVANFSAYLWWYLRRYYGPLGEDDRVTKRGYVMAQFAKFIRPGYTRIEATVNPAAGVHVSAYRGANLVIVALNLGTTEVNQTFTVAPDAAPAATLASTAAAWVTSHTLDLAAQPPLPLTARAFTASLPAESISTFVVPLVPAAPTLNRVPGSHTVAFGATAVLEVTATGEQLTYQWARDGTALPGATTALLTLPAATAATAGAYTVTVSNPGGSVTSAAVDLAVISTAAPGRLVNLSTRSPVGTADAVQIGGFVIGGATPRSVLIRAAGPVLHSRFGLNDVLADPRIELYRQTTGERIATADDWDARLAETFTAAGAFDWPEGSRDAALRVTLDPGAYSAVVRGADGGTGIALVEVYDLTPAAASGAGTLSNLSTRSLVQTDDRVQIGGFVMGGATARTVVIRAAGPVLARSFGLAEALADPVIELYDQRTGALLARADGWDPNLASHFATVGAFPWRAESPDAALVTLLDPGAYSVIVRGQDGATGTALVEIYAEP